MWIDDVRVRSALDLLRDQRLALVVGGAGTGKTMLSRTVGLRLIDDGWWPIYWDFEHLGPFPHPVAEVWQHASATAKMGRLKPMLLLENVHIATTEFAGVLAQLELDVAEQEPMIVLATARTRVRVAPSMQQRIDAVVIDLAAAARQRGDALLAWWLRDVLRLDDTTRDRAYRSVPWDRYRHDLVVLALALEAFDPAGVAAATERIEAALEDRLRRTIETHADADELLYVVAALGKYALAADLHALGAMLRRTPRRSAKSSSTPPRTACCPSTARAGRAASGMTRSRRRTGMSSRCAASTGRRGCALAIGACRERPRVR